MKLLKEHKSFSGMTQFLEHSSASTQTTMKFSVFLPREIGEIDSAIIWLSGLTCNEENFITKAAVQSLLQGTKTMVICPDTSPRGLNLTGEDESYDFGSGAGFYVNATEDPFAENYQMYDYIVKDLVETLRENFKVSKLSIMGHSMGGHGALVMGLREASLFKSVSAFSPIVNPTQCPWGKKALSGYLGCNEDSWQEYDACSLLGNGYKRSNSILIDQGLGDEFLKDQLLSDNFKKICSDVGQEVELRYQKDYDHSYYFIASFLKDHINFHLQCLTKT